MSVRCPALLIAAPASGQGKTTVTAALAAFHRKRGRRVQVFKCGPDFLDPMILQRASGHPVHQLDLWMCGEAYCRAQLYQAAQQSDLILVEGVMGLFDGNPSSADVAAAFNLPVLVVLNASGMAQTFAALALGMANLRSDVKVTGMLANRVGSARHCEMLSEYLPPELPLLGWMPRDANVALPERHLGLLQAVEIEDLMVRIDHAADALQLVSDDLPQAVEFSEQAFPYIPALLAGVKIAVARDTVFAFLYQANLDTLCSLGAQLEFFSPLNDTAMPEADALYLPGGYPELHLAQLSGNLSMQHSIRAHHLHGKPILAECGGMLYLLDRLTDGEGNSAAMTGLLPGQAMMQKRMANLGLYSIALPEGILRGHSFHYSKMETNIAPLASTVGTREGSKGEPAYRIGRLHATYLHHYFPSNPEAVARLFMP